MDRTPPHRPMRYALRSKRVSARRTHARGLVLCRRARRRDRRPHQAVGVAPPGIEPAPQVLGVDLQGFTDVLVGEEPPAVVGRDPGIGFLEERLTMSVASRGVLLEAV